MKLLFFLIIISPFPGFLMIPALDGWMGQWVKAFALSSEYLLVLHRPHTRHQLPLFHRSALPSLLGHVAKLQQEVSYRDASQDRRECYRWRWLDTAPAPSFHSPVVCVVSPEGVIRYRC